MVKIIRPLIGQCCREKAGVQQWLNQCIDTLNIQVDQFEAEIETLSGGGKKGKKKNDDAERREECQVSWSLIGLRIKILASHWSSVIT